MTTIKEVSLIHPGKFITRGKIAARFLCFAAIGILAMADSRPTAAANTLPGLSGGSINYTNDQSLGVDVLVPAAPHTVNVLDLSTGIAPVQGVTGINVKVTDGGFLSFNFDGSKNISVSGDNAYGIHARSEGGSGGSFELATNVIASITTNTVFVTNLNSTITTNISFTTNRIQYGNTGSNGPAYTASVVRGGSMIVNSAGSITTSGTAAHGILAESVYGGITFNFFGISIPFTYGDGGSVNVANSANITTLGVNSHGIAAESLGGVNGNGGLVDVLSTGDIHTWNVNSHGIFALSQGGQGSSGGGGTFGGGSDGNPGGNSTNVTVHGSGNITTRQDNSDGIFAISQAGNGGGGGDAGLGGSGGSGATGGRAADVLVDGNWGITTSGTNSHGIAAVSVGGSGGGGGSGGFFEGSGGSGGGTGDGGRVTVNSAGTIFTVGDVSHGIFAESVGGFAGSGGDTPFGLFYAEGGNGGSAGKGGTVTVNNSGIIDTLGVLSHAIFAESIGGGGGSAGSGHGLVAVGGDGNAGGDGGAVTVNNSGHLQAIGAKSRGIFAQSVGGGGGDGGSAGGIGSVGGSGSGTSGGSIVIVTNSGDIFSRAESIFAQSVGGGGGNGGSAGGWFAVGGNGGGGGDGKKVIVNNSGNLESTEADASAIVAQSVGGGGGNGGNSAAAGLFGSLAIGGTGGKGGSSDVVTVVSGTNTILTFGDRSQGIFAQSVGGGGGSGGYAFAGAVGDGFSVSIAIGGNGGDGGNGSNVLVSSGSAITTIGQNAHGIFAQSVGGGGGDGGFSIAASGGTGPALALSIGGAGGGGGNGGRVDLTSTGEIHTFGEHSYGLLAQSIGGGGGDGGFAIAGAFGTGPAVPLSFGGSGAIGGVSSAVSVISTSKITTERNDSHGIMAQSVGGGGGSGGFSVAGGFSTSSSLAVGFGGSGAPGGNSDNVSVFSTGDITTFGTHSYGILAQSIGGGGGDGGFSVAASFGKSPSLGLSLGGSGSGGGSAGAVSLFSSGIISTHGEDAHGIFAQSVGGGGGSGGFSIAATGSQGAGAALSLGGSGASGGSAGAVNATNIGDIFTAGNHAYGLLAQSIGGGGGDGGFSIAGEVGKGAGASFSMGGNGGDGKFGGAVTVNNAGNIFTGGESSYGIMAQSVGGGGGSGGFSIAGQLSQDSSGVAVAIGGAGGAGVDGGSVVLTNSGMITTTNKGSHAILAQSIGGGGGAGGFAGSLRGGTGDSKSAAVAVGGNGGTGGAASSVNVTNYGRLLTLGDSATGIYAQSVGGGGGDGGFGMALAFGTGQKNVNLSVAIGGNGGTGGVASAVFVDNRNIIETFGTNSHGIFAQSVGGGGGEGGFSAAGDLSSSTNAKQLAISIGGTGGEGNLGGNVDVLNSATIITHTNSSIGILAQSIGGGGGDGGMAFAGSVERAGSKNISVAVGGNGGTGGDAGIVNVATTGSILTYGDSSHGLEAQSVGGGGGNGGLAMALNLGIGGTSAVAQVSVSIGGTGGAGGIGSAVHVNATNDIMTKGQDAYGIFAQSVGGGGGAGGFSLSANAVLGSSKGTNRSLALAIGGEGGNGNDGGAVMVNHAGGIDTSGDGSYGILAQSIGGGGGDGGGARSMSLFISGGTGQTNKLTNNSTAINISVGGNGGGASEGGTVAVTNIGDIMTRGGGAFGIFAQSIGGGGGSGGDGHTGVADLIPNSLGSNLVSRFLATNTKQYQLIVGGQGGSSGNGKEVDVDNTGNITTLGDGAYGVMAQSVGGGGGIGGNGVIGQTNSIGLGGQGGASGDGGDVNVTIHGNVTTLGAGASGIFAQSVGGGGGTAGFTDSGLTSQGVLEIIHLATGNDGQNGGNGGKVTVKSTGDIITVSNGASGIFAQSVGGGGGLVNSGLDPTSPAGELNSLLNLAGSVGGSGSGGDVIINHAGNITTLGSNSHGIYAQSAGGSNGVGGTVSITLTGSITALGLNSDGIMAQSGGGATVVTPLNGDISISIASNSVVQGGSGQAAGVRFLDGVNNTLDNRGTVMALGGLTGMAIAGTGGNETINNYGTLVGTADLGGGGNALNNKVGGLLISGATIQLGDGNTLSNEGMLTPGGAGTIQTTALGGNFLQTSNGVMVAKLNSTSSYDQLVVSGTSALDGRLTVLRFNDFLPKKRDEFTVLTADQGVSGAYAALDDPLKGNYALQMKIIYGSNNVVVRTLQDTFTQFAHTANQQALTLALDSVSEDPSEAALIAFLNTIPGTNIATQYELISPEELGAMYDTAIGAADATDQNLQRRMKDIRAGTADANSGLSLLDQHGMKFDFDGTDFGRCDQKIDLMGNERIAEPNSWNAFAAGNGEFVDVGTRGNAAGYTIHSSGITLGADHAVSDTLSWGLTAGYVGTRANLINNGTVQVDGGKFGAYATWFDEGCYLDAALGAGYNSYTTRRAALGGFAVGDTQGAEFDGLLGLGSDVNYDRWTFGPNGSLQYNIVSIDEFTEAGSMAPLHILHNDSHSLRTQLGWHLAYDLDAGKFKVRPELGLAWQHEFLDTSRATTAQFATGAGTVFQVDSPEVGRDSLALTAGVNVRWSRRVSTFVAYDGQLGRENFLSHNVSVGVGLSF